MGQVITVSGAVGGIGTSTFAYAMALQSGSSTVLIDAQPSGAPIDLLLGMEREPGTRWSQVRVQSDAISADAVLSALPQRDGVHVLSADADAVADPRAAVHLVRALRTQCDLVVIDLPARHALHEVDLADVRVLLVPPTVLGVGAVLASAVPTHLIIVDTGNGDFAAAHIAQYLPHATPRTIRWQHAIGAAGRACTPPPDHTDAMRIAADLWQEVSQRA